MPFKYNPNNISHQDAVKYAGLIYDLILFSKRTLDDLKKTPHHGNMTLRLRLKTGSEIVVVQGKIMILKKYYNKNLCFLHLIILHFRARLLFNHCSSLQNYSR